MTPSSTHVRTIVAASAALLLAACGDGPPAVAPPAPSCTLAPSFTVAPAMVPTESPYDSLFIDAATEFGVPLAVLRAVGYAETRWQMVEGEEEFHGQPAAFGVMGLRGARVSDGARRAGATEASVRTDPRANIRAGAALLRFQADSLGIRGSDPALWELVVARYSGIRLPAGAASYVRDVYAVIDGRRAMPERTASTGTLGAPCGTTPTPPPTNPPTVDFAGAAWRASPNSNQRMAGDGGRIHMVIIHSCEGGYAGCWSWLANIESQVSAHYVVREDGAEITQLVRESGRAWHIAATYDSTLNANHDGRLQGTQSNHFTIGIEHAGYASQTAWPEAQIDASARLVCSMAQRWEIPRDRLHIVSHGQLQPYNRTDPGAGWPWADYLVLIDKYCTV